MAAPDAITWDDEGGAGIAWDPPDFSAVKGGVRTTAPMAQFAPIGDQPPDFGTTPQAEAQALRASETTRNQIASELPKETGAGLLRGVSGLLGAAGGGLQIMSPGSGIQDDAFKAADSVKAIADSLTQGDTQPAAKIGGGLISGLAGGFLGDPMAQGMQTIREGGSLGKAEAQNAIGSAANEIGLGAGLLGSQAGGLAPYLTRAAVQVPTNMAVTAGSNALEGKETSGTDLALAAGTGLFGALFRNPSHVEALAGEHGPEAQGSATADTILAAADDTTKATEGLKNPAESYQLPPISSESSKPLPGEPDIAPGDTRLFHGGEPGDHQGDLWFSKDRRYAQGYADKSGAGIHYVDLPSDHPLIADDHEAGVYGPTNVNLPAELALRRKRLSDGNDTSPALDVAPDRTQLPPEALGPFPPLYHGTKQAFDTFAEGTEGSASDPGVFGRGHYATTDPRLASIYAGKGEGANVRQVESALENPKVFDSPQAAVEWQGERGTDSPEAAERIRQKYTDAGHDGVVIKNNQGRPQEVVAFDSAKFKTPGEERVPETEITPPASDQVPPRPAEEPIPSEGRPAGDNAAVEGRPATSAENEPTRSLTGIKNESIAQARERRAAEELTPAEKVTWEQEKTTAKQKLDETPGYGEALAQSLIKEPRALRGDEGAVLLHHQTTLENQHAEVSQRMAKAADEGDTVRYSLEKQHLDDIERNLDANERASQIAGTHGGRGLNFRRAMMAEDYSFARIRTVAKAKKGAELTPEQTQKLKDLTDQAQQHQQRIADLESSNKVMQDQMERMKPTSKPQKESAQTKFKSLSEELRRIAKKDQLVDPNCLVTA